MKEITFGKYFHDPKAYEGGKFGSIVNGKLVLSRVAQQPIEWLVLHEDDEKFLLLSKCSLLFEPFNGWPTNDAPYAKCTLRTWLAKLEEHLTPDEKKRLIRNEATDDFFFVLSKEEVEQYLPEMKQRICLTTAFAISRLPKSYIFPEDKPCSWWLRTPSTDDNHYTMTVDDKGKIWEHGDLHHMKANGARPAVWIRRME